MASNNAEAASAGKGAEAVVDVDNFAPPAQTKDAEPEPPPAQTKDAEPEPPEFDKPFAELDSKYPFQMSAWDASLFIGHKGIGCAGSVAMVLILAATIVIQGGFCWIAVDKLSKSQYGDAVTQNLRWWRTDAHLEQYGQGARSLVERVCNGDPTLMLGTDLKARVAMIKDYIPEFADSVIASGPTMVLLALAIWYAALTKELHNIINFSLAIVQVPKGPRTRLVMTPDGGVTMATLGKVRIPLAAVLVVVRLSLASVLCYAGTLRTAYTTNWGGILLNAIKLNFIAGVSDVLFATTMPENVKMLFKKLKPLNKPRVRAWKGLDAWSCTVLILVPAGLVAAYYSVIAPEVSYQLDAYNALCDGDRQFQHMNLHNMIVSLDGDPYERRDPESDLLYVATQELIDGSTGAGSLSLESPGVTYFDSFKTLDPHELGDVVNPTCMNLLDTDPAMMQNWIYQVNHAEYFRRSAGDQSISSCADVARYCTEGAIPGGTVWPLATALARRFCPETCGCDSPYVLYDRGYCPLHGCTQTMNYMTLVAAAPCVDNTNLSAKADWRSLAGQLAESVATLPTENHGTASAAGLLPMATTDASRDAVLAAQNQSLSLEATHEFLMIQLGCGYVGLARSLSGALGGAWGDPCFVGGGGAFMYHCPDTCWCNLAVMTGCPPTCAR